MSALRQQIGSRAASCMLSELWNQLRCDGAAKLAIHVDYPDALAWSLTDAALTRCCSDGAGSRQSPYHRTTPNHPRLGSRASQSRKDRGPWPARGGVCSQIWQLSALCGEVHVDGRAAFSWNVRG